MKQSYVTVVFVQGEEYDEIQDMGPGAMFEHLAQWDTGEYGHVYDEAPWGRLDRTYEYGPDYVLAIGQCYASWQRLHERNHVECDSDRRARRVAELARVIRRRGAVGGVPGRSDRRRGRVHRWHVYDRPYL